VKHNAIIYEPGARFGALTIQGLSDKRTPRGDLYWLCRCDCGRRALAIGSALRAGRVKSCARCCRRGNTKLAYTHNGEQQEWLMILARPAFRLRDRGASGVKDIWPITPEVNTPHPAPFPLALAVRALETTKRGRVLDPYAGWGTTLVAAKLLGREAIGIELEERFCELAANRLRQEVLPVVEAVPELVPLFE
jgi:hypothetical protein